MVGYAIGGAFRGWKQVKPALAEPMELASTGCSLHSCAGIRGTSTFCSGVKDVTRIQQANGPKELRAWLKPQDLNSGRATTSQPVRVESALESRTRFSHMLRFMFLSIAADWVSW